MKRFSDVSMLSFSVENSSLLTKSNDNYDDDQYWRSQSKSSHASSHDTYSSVSSDSSKYSQRSLEYFSGSSDRDNDRDRHRSLSNRAGHSSSSRREKQQHSMGRASFSCQDHWNNRTPPSPYRSRPRAKVSDSDYNNGSPVNSSLYCSTVSSVSSPSRSISFGVLPMSYWERSPGCRDAKLNHMDRMDHFCDDNREYLILQTTLWNRFITLERNMFPYDTPPQIEHWTLWCREEMTHVEVCRYVEDWLRRHMPHVRRWNYDDNSGDRSIDLFHVHVYIESSTPYGSPHSRSSPPLSSDVEGEVNLAHLVRVRSSGGETESSGGEE